MVLFVVELEIMGILDIRLSDIKNIIFPKAIRAAIISIWIGGSFIIGVFPVFTRIKRNLLYHYQVLEILKEIYFHV